MNHIKTYLTLVLITLAFASFAQKKKQISKAEKPEYRVYYQHQHIRDLAHPEVVHQEEMMLLVGQKTSLFTSYDKLRLTYENENDLSPAFFPAFRLARRGGSRVKSSTGSPGDQ